MDDTMESRAVSELGEILYQQPQPEAQVQEELPGPVEYQLTHLQGVVARLRDRIKGLQRVNSDLTTDIDILEDKNAKLVQRVQCLESEQEEFEARHHQEVRTVKRTRTDAVELLRYEASLSRKKARRMSLLMKDLDAKVKAEDDEDDGNGKAATPDGSENDGSNDGENSETAQNRNNGEAAENRDHSSEFWSSDSSTHD